MKIAPLLIAVIPNLVGCGSPNKRTVPVHTENAHKEYKDVGDLFLEQTPWYVERGGHGPVAENLAKCGALKARSKKRAECISKVDDLSRSRLNLMYEKSDAQYVSDYYKVNKDEALPYWRKNAGVESFPKEVSDISDAFASLMFYETLCRQLHANELRKERLAELDRNAELNRLRVEMLESDLAIRRNNLSNTMDIMQINSGSGTPQHIRIPTNSNVPIR